MRMQVLLLAALLGLCPVVFSAEKSVDPNASVRKTVVSDPLATIREVERVQRTNNEISVRHFTSEIQKDPKKATAYARRGKAYAGLKDYAKAGKDYEQAIALDPELAEAYVGRAVLRYIQKDYKASWEDVHKAESLGGEFWPSFMEALKAASGREK